MLTAWQTSQAMRTAMAWMAGPERPAVGRDTRLLRVRTSIDIAGMVLMTVRPSAPAASTAGATSLARAGASFTMRGRFV